MPSQRNVPRVEVGSTWVGKVAIPETLPLQLRKNDPIFEHGLARLTELLGGRVVLIEVRTVFQVSSECTRAVACLDPYDTGHVYFCILPSSFFLVHSTETACRRTPAGPMR